MKILFKMALRPIFISIALLMSLSSYAYDFEANGLYFDLISLSNRTCRLTSGSTSYSGALQIPETVNYEGLSFSVVELDAKAFNSNITELTIPSTVNTIPSGTITKCKLTKLVFQDGKNPLRVDDYVEIGHINYGPTYGQPLSHLYIGRTLTNNGSFSYSLALTKVEIGEFVTSLPYFYGSNKLEYLFIPDNVVTLQGEGLGSCLGLKTVYVGNGVSKIANGFFIGSTALETVYLGNNITEIGWAAFHNCKNLTNLYIFSNKISSIADNTTDGIDYCLPTSISKIYIPDPSRYENLLKNYYRDYLITINNTAIEYSGKAPSFSFSNNVNGASIGFSTSNLNINAGSYSLPIEVVFSFDNGWNTSAKVSASYTITPAPLMILANDVTKKYGAEIPELTCSFFGFKNGENKEVLTRLPNVETTASTTSNVGTYPIIPSGAEAQNYTFNYERGILTIIKADQTIEWEQQLGTVNVGDVVELTATSSAGLPIKYTSTDESIAEIFTQGGKKYVEFLKPGNVSIRATQDGNENYNEADRISKSVKVDLPALSGIEWVSNTDNSIMMIIQNGEIHILNKDSKTIVRVFSIQGLLITETTDAVIDNLTAGLYIVTIGSKSYKVRINP